MRRIDTATFREMLRLHELWMQNDPSGKQANFSNIHVTNDEATGLLDAKFAGLHLVDFSNSHFTGVNFKCADLAFANCENTSFVSCDFSWANLSSTNFVNVNPAGSVFYDTGFYRANIRSTNFDFASITGPGAHRSILRVGPICGEMMTAVKWPDGPRISHGGGWYTVRAAETHYTAADTRKRAGLHALLALVRAHGWASV